MDKLQAYATAKKRSISHEIERFFCILHSEKLKANFCNFFGKPQRRLSDAYFSKAEKNCDAYPFFGMPFTAAKRLRKPRRSGNREMKAALCKPQNFSPKSRQNFSDFHNKLFSGLEGAQNGSGRREKHHFVHYAQKRRKSPKNFGKQSATFLRDTVARTDAAFALLGRWAICPYGSKSCESALSGFDAKGRGKMLKSVDRYKAALDAARPFEASLLRELRDYYKIGLT